MDALNLLENGEGAKATAPDDPGYYYPHCKPVTLSNPYKSTKWLIKGLLPVGITMLSAESSVGKTFLCVSLATAVAYLGKWVDGRDVVRNGYVMYLAGEDQLGVQERFIGAWEHYGLDARQAEREKRIHILDGMPFKMALGHSRDLDNPTISDFLDELDDMVTAGKCEYPVLVIVDTLGNFMEGSGDKGADAIAFMRCMEEIQRRTGGAVLFTHHEKKYSDAPMEKDKTSYTGSARFRDLADYAYRLKGDSGNPCLTLVNYKARWGESGQSVRLRKVPHPILLSEMEDDEGNQPSTLVIELDDAVPEEKPNPVRMTLKQGEDIETIKGCLLWNRFEPSANEARIELTTLRTYLKEALRWDDEKIKNSTNPNKRMVKRFLDAGWYRLEGKTLICIDIRLKDLLRKWRIQKGYQIECGDVSQAVTQQGPALPDDGDIDYPSVSEPAIPSSQSDYSLFGGDGLDDDDDTDIKDEWH